MDYSLKKFFASPFPAKALPYLLLAFAAFGFLDASYLTILHYKNLIPPCTIGGCDTVLTSKYATVLGIPLSLWGAGFYGVILVLNGLFLTLHASFFSKLLFVLCSLGFLVGIGLVALQAFVLHAWCYYCLFSEFIDFLLFDAGWWLYTNSSAE